MPRQLKYYECGAACLKTVLGLGGETVPLSLFDNICNEKTGVETDSLAFMCEKVSKNFVSSGENTYKKGMISIANITNPLSGIGHFVVFLRKKGKEVVYYDPLTNDIETGKIGKDFEFISGDKKHQNFTINFLIKEPAMESLFSGKCIHIINNFSDECEETMFLKQIYEKNNIDCIIHDPSHIEIIEGELYFNGIKPKKQDTIWIRIKPTDDIRYFSTLRILALFEDQFSFINKPSFILQYDNKTIPIKIKLKTALNKKIYGGSRVLHAPNNAHLIMNSVFKKMNRSDERDVAFGREIYSKEFRDKMFPVILEPNVEDTHGDNSIVRIFWWKKSFYGGLEVSSRSNRIVNMDSNRFKIRPIREVIDDIDIFGDLEKINNFFLENTVTFASVDILNNKLITEVNVSDTAGFKSFIEGSEKFFILE